ncbi:sulfurtransferase-like selenium metabolism protein YedF [Sporosalibacterium faouarense]|uniref:sulfurtransferase-like selenium metabolism protein YedF n=1 Tax=Sporosalibacterium faouarense TaxID=516123 RepID=UPI00141C717B|nr:sulfurtransferase-like selenium metabolism protein YedF [Sporosalibacterium faouarense]MTI46212.1 sulfurtransferase-like selenium metabolism protein YedF [Bacillota bacterium]
MRKEVDARGQNCPKPVIMTKKALEEINEGTISCIVDNEVAKENVSKLAKSLNFEYEVDKTKEGHFYVHITKGEGSQETEVCIPDTLKDMTIVFGSNRMGEGGEELGDILMKGFIYTLTESTPYPSTLVFLNSGVKLTTQGSKSIEDLKTLEENGVEILSCGTCLDYYGIADKLQIGEVTNMYTIVEKMKNATNTIKL